MVITSLWGQISGLEAESYALMYSGYRTGTSHILFYYNIIIIHLLACVFFAVLGAKGPWFGFMSLIYFLNVFFL